MATVDENLEISLGTLISYLNKNHITAGGWVLQVNLFSGKKLRVIGFANGLPPGDPITGLEVFGRDVTDTVDVDTVVVLADMDDGLVMCSAADKVGNLAVASVTLNDGLWSVSARVDSTNGKRINNPERVPTTAVWRGIKSKN